MKVLTNQFQRFLTIFVFMFISFQFSQGIAQAKIYSPVIIEPYDEESLKKINESFTSLKTYVDKVKADRSALLEATKNNATNPTPENGAVLIEMTGQTLNTTVEFLAKSEAALGRAIPEIQKYKDYLRKIAKSMETQSENAFLSEQSKWAQKEVKAIESFLNELEGMRNDFKNIQQDFAAFTSAWVHSKQIERELKVVFSGGKIGSIRKEIAQTIDEIYEIKKVVMDQLKEGTLSNSTDNYEDGREAYKSAINKYFNN
jgi:flagellar biosynthesis chaperone FliJ